MCLREKKTNMRKYVYETLSIMVINESSLLVIILEKIFVVLQLNKSDKKFIYRMLMCLGTKYQKWVKDIIGKLCILEQGESNWKSVIYKAKMVFCYTWWSGLQQRDGFPFHFNRHMLYIKDVEHYLFKEDNGMHGESYWIDFKAMPLDSLVGLIEE